jgi:hypothetical protein
MVQEDAIFSRSGVWEQTYLLPPCLDAWMSLLNAFGPYSIVEMSREYDSSGRVLSEEFCLWSGRIDAV